MNRNCFGKNGMPAGDSRISIMSKFVVMIEGRNCLMIAPEPKGLKRLKKSSRPIPSERLGFFTTRCVEAVDAGAAKEVALDLVADELRGKKMIQNAAENPPTLTISEVRILEPSESMPLGKGFTFFPEEKTN